ncbi:hypothetical protein F4679DRAFT_550736 [Xylaria curta]|nr:hypothetical protein F4679DRAFT_550736 [Xylaria curta]
MPVPHIVLVHNAKLIVSDNFAAFSSKMPKGCHPFVDAPICINPSNIRRIYRPVANVIFNITRSTSPGRIMDCWAFCSQWTGACMLRVGPCLDFSLPFEPSLYRSQWISLFQ